MYIYICVCRGIISYLLSKITDALCVSPAIRIGDKRFAMISIDFAVLFYDSAEEDILIITVILKGYKS